jgi:hypothetical protein
MNAVGVGASCTLACWRPGGTGGVGVSWGGGVGAKASAATGGVGVRPDPSTVRAVPVGDGAAPAARAGGVAASAERSVVPPFMTSDKRESRVRSSTSSNP